MDLALSGHYTGLTIGEKSAGKHFCEILKGFSNSQCLATKESFIHLIQVKNPKRTRIETERILKSLIPETV